MDMRIVILITCLEIHDVELKVTVTRTAPSMYVQDYILVSALTRHEFIALSLLAKHLL